MPDALWDGYCMRDGVCGAGAWAHTFARMAIHIACSSGLVLLSLTAWNELAQRGWLWKLRGYSLFVTPVVIACLLVFLREPLDVGAGDAVGKSYWDLFGWAGRLRVERRRAVAPESAHHDGAGDHPAPAGEDAPPEGIVMPAEAATLAADLTAYAVATGVTMAAGHVYFCHRHAAAAYLGMVVQASREAVSDYDRRALIRDCRALRTTGACAATHRDVRNGEDPYTGELAAPFSGQRRPRRAAPLRLGSRPAVEPAAEEFAAVRLSRTVTALHTNVEQARQAAARVDAADRHGLVRDRLAPDLQPLHAPDRRRRREGAGRRHHTGRTMTHGRIRLPDTGACLQIAALLALRVRLRSVPERAADVEPAAGSQRQAEPEHAARRRAHGAL